MNVRVTRVARFSAAHNYWLEGRSAEENRRLFGSAASPTPHGHNYRIELTVTGPVDPTTGMVVNVSEIEETLRTRVMAELDGRWLNREVADFADAPATLENLALFVWRRLEGAFREARPVVVRVAESDALFADYAPERKENAMELTRVYEFCASHRLHNVRLSDEENRELFGVCNNPHGHGHNYVLEVTVTGRPDQKSGMLADLKTLDRVVDNEVVSQLDHKHLNHDVPEFRDRVATTENLTKVIWDRLDGKLPVRLTKVLVRETSNNFFEYRGPDDDA